MAAKIHENMEVLHKEDLSGTHQRYQRTASLDNNVDGKLVFPVYDHKSAMANATLILGF
jgi:hypothetical protein